MAQYTPWSARSKDEPPYALLRAISPKGPDAQPFYCVAAFPWRKDSLDELLYKGAASEKATLQHEWKKMVDIWTGAVLVGSVGCFHIFRKLGNGKPTCVTIARPPDWKNRWNVRAIAWAVARSEPTHPVAIVAISRVLYIVDLFPDQPTVIGRLRGHGDDITSISVNPYYPYLFLTTSKDSTTRMYDLTYTPRQTPNNPPWPPAQPDQPSLAGPAFGLHMSEPEGDGIGRCIAVLAGGYSGGHQGTVYKAAWHPSADLIATCGMDRCVKIWRVPFVDHAKVEINEEHLAREDKPLFSTSLIHKARVFSIAWLSHDILVSHSAPALMRGESVDDMYDIPGTVSVWMWLAFKRFLSDGRVRRIMRVPLNDYTQSDSFKMLAEYSLPMNCRAFTFAPIVPIRQNPQLFVDDGANVYIFNIADFKPRPPPPFPLDVPDESERTPDESELDAELAERVDNMSVSDKDDGEEADGDEGPPVTYKRQPPPLDLTENVAHWTITKDIAGLNRSKASIDRWQVAFRGQLLLSVNEEGTLSMWTLT